MNKSFIFKYHAFENLANLTLIDINHDSGSVKVLRLIFRLFLFPLFLIYRASKIIVSRLFMTPLLYLLFAATDTINKQMPTRKQKSGFLRSITKLATATLILMCLILNMDHNYLPQMVTATVPISATTFQNSQKGKTVVPNSDPGIFDRDKEEELNEIIQHAIDIYHQDVIEKADFALKLNGGQIIYTLTSHSIQKIPKWLHFIHWYIHPQTTFLNSPELAISPQTNVGKCWSMYGNRGTLGIRLGKPMLIQSITVDYPSCEIMQNRMDNAPRLIELFGIPDASAPKKGHVSLGSVEYKTDCVSPIQTFVIAQDPETVYIYSAVMIRIHSNWGSKNHTDIYRIRIHGLPMEK